MLRLIPSNNQKIIQVNSFDATYGGGEANVIASLASFGHETKFVTKLPNNSLGDKVIRDLRSYNIDTSNILQGDGRLGIYFLEFGHGLRSTEVIYDRKYSLTIEIAKYCNKTSILVSFDSNYRAKLWILEDAKGFLEKVLPSYRYSFFRKSRYDKHIKYEACDLEFEDSLKNLYERLFAK